MFVGMSHEPGSLVTAGRGQQSELLFDLRIRSAFMSEMEIQPPQLPKRKC